MSDINLLSWGGLGDVLATLPIAYALQEHGKDSRVLYKLHQQFETVNPTINDLSPLPLYSGKVSDDAQQLDLTDHWQWTDQVPLLETNLSRLRLLWGTTPRTAFLQKPVDSENVAIRYCGTTKDYVLVCAGGRSAHKEKALSIAQLVAIREECTKNGMLMVLVGDQTDINYPTDIDLRGKTTLRDLCSLTYHASVVVSTDTGLLHLAGAFSTPLLALSPGHLLPVSVLQDYAPKIVKSASVSAAISPQEIQKALYLLIRVVRTPFSIVGPTREPDGVTDNGRMMAQALGVPYVAYGKTQTKYNIVEYIGHGDDYTLANVMDKSHAVLSMHTTDRTELDSWGGIIFRGIHAYRQLRHLPRFARYAPLPSAYLADAPRKCHSKELNICWHGIIVKQKGLEALVNCWEQLRIKHPKVTLTLMGSIIDGYCDVQSTSFVQRCEQRHDPSLIVKIANVHTPAQRHYEFLNADLFCFADLNDKEQSAATANVLGYGVPVMTSSKTAHADTRGWCYTFKHETMVEDINAILSDATLYDKYARRAWLGAQYRKLDLIARHYRASIQQAMINNGDV